MIKIDAQYAGPCMTNKWSLGCSTILLLFLRHKKMFRSITRTTTRFLSTQKQRAPETIHHPHHHSQHIHPQGRHIRVGVKPTEDPKAKIFFVLAGVGAVSGMISAILFFDSLRWRPRDV